MVLIDAQPPRVPQGTERQDKDDKGAQDDRDSQQLRQYGIHKPHTAGPRKRRALERKGAEDHSHSPEIHARKEQDLHQARLALSRPAQGDRIDLPADEQVHRPPDHQDQKGRQSQKLKPAQESDASRLHPPSVYLP